MNTVRGTAIHSLKSWPEQFGAVWRGDKTHEVRRWDRDFQVGDEVYLYEYRPGMKEFSPRYVRCRIRHITAPGDFGLPPEVGVFSIEVIQRGTNPPAIARRYCEGTFQQPPSP